MDGSVPGYINDVLSVWFHVTIGMDEDVEIKPKDTFPGTHSGV
jgi:hypothetical protein